jgi:hypothetical protein
MYSIAKSKTQATPSSHGTQQSCTGYEGAADREDIQRITVLPPRPLPGGDVKAIFGLQGVIGKLFQATASMNGRQKWLSDFNSSYRQNSLPRQGLAQRRPRSRRPGRPRPRPVATWESSLAVRSAFAVRTRLPVRRMHPGVIGRSGSCRKRRFLVCGRSRCSPALGRPPTILSASSSMMSRLDGYEFIRRVALMSPRATRRRNDRSQYNRLGKSYWSTLPPTEQRYGSR